MALARSFKKEVEVFAPDNHPWIPPQMADRKMPTNSRSPDLRPNSVPFDSKPKPGILKNNPRQPLPQLPVELVNENFPA